MDRKGLAILILAVVILFMLFSPQGSRFVSSAIAPMGMSTNGSIAAPLMGGSDGVPSVSSASLIPHEVVQTLSLIHISEPTRPY